MELLHFVINPLILNLPKKHQFVFQFLPSNRRAGGGLSSSASVCQTIRPLICLSIQLYKLTGLHSNWKIFFKSFLKLGWIIHSSYQDIRQVWWWLSQLIIYVHNLLNFKLCVFNEFSEFHFIKSLQYIKWLYVFLLIRTVLPAICRQPQTFAHMITSE